MPNHYKKPNQPSTKKKPNQPSTKKPNQLSTKKKPKTLEEQIASLFSNTPANVQAAQDKDKKRSDSMKLFEQGLQESKKWKIGQGKDRKRK